MIRPRTAVILFLAALTTACGIKGDLFIPERPAVNAVDGSKAAVAGPSQ